MISEELRQAYMLASGAFRGGYKRPTAILRDPVPALSGDFDLLSLHPGAVRNQCDGPLSVADKVVTGLDP